MTLPTIHLVVLKSVPIFEQLQLEEALLRADRRNFCIINCQSPPAIVMGISGKVEELIDPDHFERRPVPVIRRFSGGGTVLIDEETLFLSFIFNRADQDIGTCPKRLLCWTEALLKPAFSPIDFQLRENDYVLGDKKIGGNAQYFTKTRWLHHTSFLWDYSESHMKVLKMPPKIPEYRQLRDHDAFCTRLKPHFASKEALFSRIQKQLQEQFALQECPVDEARKVLSTPHRQATQFVEIPNLGDEQA